MNVRVTDTVGQTLAAGRDLNALQQQLGVEAAEAFTAIDDPRWNRDGLTTWDFDDSADGNRSRHKRLAMKAYPALVDGGRLCEAAAASDSRQRADRETRLGLRRLFLLSAWREVKTQVDWLPGLDKAQPVAALIPGFDLRRQLADLLAVRVGLTKQRFPALKLRLKRH